MPPRRNSPIAPELAGGEREGDAVARIPHDPWSASPSGESLFLLAG